MNKAQRNYINAKAAYEIAASKVTADEANYPGLDEMDMPEYIKIMMEIEDRYNANELRETYYAAETALINWGANVIKKRGDYTPTIAMVFNAVEKSIKIRKEVVELTLRLKSR